MALGYRVLVTPAFERDVRRWTKRDRSLLSNVKKIVSILARDPWNSRRLHPIRKLAGVNPGGGQWRIRIGGYRLRYDIIGRDVVLYSFKRRDQAYE